MKVHSSIFLIFLLVTGLSPSCQEASKGPSGQIISRDTTISTKSAFSTLFIDSSYLEHFLADRQVIDTGRQLYRNFYNQRNFSLAWFDSSGIAEQANLFWNLQANYIAFSGDSSIYNPFLQQWADSVGVYGARAIPDSLRSRIELELTGQFFRYAAKAYMGNLKLNSADLGWFIPRRKVDILALLDSVSNNKGKDIKHLEPVNRQYGLLREALNRYYEIEKQGAWDHLATTQKKITIGDTGQAVLQLKRRLFLSGDLGKMDSVPLFDTALAAAVRKFQYRYGLREDGIVGGATLQEINRPINYRIRQILVNMERLRWVPDEPATDYLLVNIPEYRLHVYEKGRNLVFNMNVVVGSTTHHSVIFTGNLKNIVFSPYWYVPPGILQKEVLPGIKRNKNYLSSHNMEWNGGNVRQKPGPKNSLGLVKFLFPNSYNIYLHDTPSKSLFNESKRDFSHGCIRVAEPKKLAAWLLRDEKSWTSEKIDAAMHKGSETWVTIKQELPVFIGYFTAWVDRQGNLNFREDIYGHDKIMMEKMFR
ncbi:L,D-transpeptidase family protein [Flavihumibacter petaseus]|uniref:Putative L,D-transpeptidase n=1 Tax=Flavihumibacter petaseus NBRC 106054 TaxID=1220578 RepID=A0A0E9N6K2_9BACT|nr:L,D-transpeptidase family protein [Flavihumibacter petaseus]GAO44970.1 putative L,D-transpeptidase [Flavihumibacter petaseus NBRC 106054]